MAVGLNHKSPVIENRRVGLHLAGEAGKDSFAVPPKYPSPLARLFSAPEQPSAPGASGVP